MIKLKKILTEVNNEISKKEYKQLAKEFIGTNKHQIIRLVKNTGYADIELMVSDTVDALEYDPEYRNRVDADTLYDFIIKELKTQSWWKKLDI